MANLHLKSKIKKSKVSKYVLKALAVGTFVIVPLVTVAVSQTEKALPSLASAKLKAQTTVDPISGKQFISATISQKDFTFLGQNGEGRARLRPAKPEDFAMLDAYVSQNLANPNAWTSNVPSGLKNGDVFYIRLAVKDENQAKYAIAPNLAAIKVEGLELESIQNPIDNIKNYGDFSQSKLDATFFNFSGVDGEGVAYLNQKGVEALSPALVEGEDTSKKVVHKSPGFDLRLEAQFSKDQNTYTPKLTSLSNGEKIYARIDVKDEYKDILAIDKTVKPGSPEDLYEPVELTVSGLPSGAAQNLPLDFNNVNFNGENNFGSVTYEGFNKDEYKNGLTYTRTYGFVSAFDDLGFKLNHENNIYQTRNAKGQPEFNYRYLAPLKPVNVEELPVSEDKPLVITAFEPFVINRKPMKQVIIEYVVMNGLESRINASPETFLASQNKFYSTMEINYDEKGIFATATFKGLDFLGEPKNQNVEPFDYEDKKMIYVDAVRYSPSVWQNLAYLYIDKDQNIGIGLDSADGDDGHNGIAVSTTISKITYQDNSVWDKNVNPKVENDLANGEWVSIMPTAKVDGITTDLEKKGISVKVSGLQTGKPLVVLPALNDSYFEINKKDNSLILKANTPLEQTKDVADLLYSRDAITFSKELPKNLQDRELLFVIQILKQGEKAYGVPNMQILTLGLPVPVKIALTDLIDKDSFVTSVKNDSVTVNLKPSIKLSDKVSLEWKKENGEWNENLPSDLKVGDNLIARLVVKDQYAETHILNNGWGYETIIKIASPTNEAIDKTNETIDKTNMPATTEPSKLSTAAIAGIAVGSSIGFVLLALLGFFLYKRTGKKPGKNS